MFSSAVGIAFLISYVAIVFLLATYVERRAAAGTNLGNHSVIYTLSFAVWLTAWSFYGQVGRAAVSGMLYLTSHLGATLSIILWWTVLRKMVRIRHEYRITSIADLISLRYDKSQAIAALATVIAILGIVPYLALQLKAVITTFAIIVQSPNGAGTSWGAEHVGALIVVFMILFTILFGVRRLVPTERHQGMVVAMAVESIVKLLAFLAVGIFVVYVLFHGMGDVFERFAASPAAATFAGKPAGPAVVAWVSNLLMAMSAVIFVPALFHIMVVENFHEDHIRTSMWLFPLFMLIINIFVLPIAMAGLLMGHPLQQADQFMLTLPFQSGHGWLSLVAFIGGFSSAMGMLVVNTMTLSTMFTNHLLLPAFGSVRSLGFLKRYLLQCRWGAVAAFILASYWFEEQVVQSSMLADLGVYAFVAVLQFAPTMLGGLFWKRGNRVGALLGMGSGLFLWMYTLILPAFVRSGWIRGALLEQGPAGLRWLRPEHLFGVAWLDSASHAVLWTLVFNIGLYVLGSLYFEQSSEEEEIAAKFMTILDDHVAAKQLVSGEPVIGQAWKKMKIQKLFSQYVSAEHAEEVSEQCLASLGLEQRQVISIVELAELHREVEKRLASSIGAAEAHAAAQKAGIFSASEEAMLKKAYAGIIHELKLPPSDLVRKIGSYRENERQLMAQAQELEWTIRERNREILERNRAEEALRNSERQMADVINLLPDATFAVDREGRITIWNRAAEAFTGLKAADILGKGGHEYAIPFFGDRRPILIDMVMEPSLSLEGHYQYFRREGDIVSGEAYTRNGRGEAVYLMGVAAPLYGSEGQVTGAIESIRDLTERKRMEEALAEEKERLAVTLRSIGDGVITTDTEGRVVLINNVAEHLTGWTLEEAVGRPLPEVYHILDEKTRLPRVNPVDQVIRTGGIAGVEGHPVLISKTGQERIISDSGAPIRDQRGMIIGAVLVFRDVTDTSRMEEELIRAQKLDSVGLLAGGIAHDFNNILTAILGNISLAKMDASPGDAVARRLEEAEKACLRAKDLTQQLLTFSRGGAPIKKVTSLAEVILDSTQFALRGADVRSEVHIADDLWPVEVDEGQISQVIQNMVINAAQAMPGGGLVTLRAENIEAGAGNLPLGPRKQIRLSIHDTGIGLPKEHLDRIFDPYFTTKAKGNGLGLTTSYSIVKKHDGTIAVESEEGRGTTFFIYLPATAEPGQPPAPREGERLLANGGKVLLMDDEAAIRDIAGEMLKCLGCEVVFARDGWEALDRYAAARGAGQPFDLVILDLTIPGSLGGKETMRKLLGLDPEARAIVSSGYSMDPVMANFREHGFRCVVTKPYKLEELSAALKEALVSGPEARFKTIEEDHHLRRV